MENKPAPSIDGVVTQSAAPKPVSVAPELVENIPVRAPNQPGQTASQQLVVSQLAQPKVETQVKPQAKAPEAPKPPKTDSTKITAISLVAVAVASGLIYLVFRS